MVEKSFDSDLQAGKFTSVLLKAATVAKKKRPKRKIVLTVSAASVDSPLLIRETQLPKHGSEFGTEVFCPLNGKAIEVAKVFGRKPIAH